MQLAALQVHVAPLGGAELCARRESLLWNPPAEENPLASELAVLRRRSERHAPVMERLRVLFAQGALCQPRPHLAASLVHRHANRMLRAAARAQELVRYDFLHRLYESRAARQRQET